MESKSPPQQLNKTGSKYTPQQQEGVDITSPTNSTRRSWNHLHNKLNNTELKSPPKKLTQQDGVKLTVASTQ